MDSLSARRPVDEFSAPWAMVGNERQHGCQCWLWWEFGICKLQIHFATSGFESHPLRHS